MSDKKKEKRNKAVIIPLPSFMPNIKEIRPDSMRIIGGRVYSCKESKGRKMLVHQSLLQYETAVEKQIKGETRFINKRRYRMIVLTDYGVAFQTISRICYSSESYDMPDGSKVHSKWKLYEAFMPKDLSPSREATALGSGF